MTAIEEMEPDTLEVYAGKADEYGRLAMKYAKNTAEYVKDVLSIMGDPCVSMRSGVGDCLAKLHAKARHYASRTERYARLACFCADLTEECVEAEDVQKSICYSEKARQFHLKAHSALTLAEEVVRNAELVAKGLSWDGAP